MAFSLFLKKYSIDVKLILTRQNSLNVIVMLSLLSQKCSYRVIKVKMVNKLEVKVFCLCMTQYYFADNAKAEYINFRIKVKGQV